MINISEDTFAGTSYMTEEDILSDFTCMLCYGIALQPLKCKGCETIYCSACLPEDAHDPSVKFKPGQRKYQCYKLCGKSELGPLSRIEKNFLSNIPFKCQHEEEFGCKAVVKYEDYRKHLQNDCVHKIELPAEKVYGPKVLITSAKLILGGPGAARVIDDQNRILHEAQLANLFLEEGEEPVPFVEFVPQVIAVVAPVAAPVAQQRIQEEEEDIDMGGLFGDEEDY